MKHRFLRVFCWLLGVMIFLAGTEVSEAASAYSCGESVTWRIDQDGVLTISGTGDMYSYTEQTAPWGLGSCKKVIIEDGVTSIGSWAFSQCISMRSIEIPESVTKIGDYAFNRCYYLKSISLPDSICEIGANPFRACTALEEIIVSSDHPVLSYGNGMLSSIPDHRLVCRLPADSSFECVLPEGTQVIGDYAFYDCDKLHRLMIPEGVTTIGDWAFCGCGVLGSVDFPGSLMTIGDFAFDGCKNLFSARFSEGLESIGTAAFACCWLLKEFDLPDSLTDRGGHPFDDCRVLSVFHVSDDHPVYGILDGILYSKTDMKMIFSLAGNESETFTVPEGITIIGERAFSNCRTIRKIILPESLLWIEREAFWVCDRTEEIEFSEGLMVIDEKAFCEMVRLKEAILPEGLVSIGDQAFRECTALEKVVIPGSVTSIGEDLFLMDDTQHLTVIVSEGSAGEEYCSANELKMAYPGQEAPEADGELPPAFAAQYPGYTGISRMDTSEGSIMRHQPGEKELAWLAEAPDGKRVLLCGTEREGTGWTIIESTPLPAGTEVIMDDGIQMLDLGDIHCNICRYYDDLWGIYMVGWLDYFVGPDWIGSRDVLGRQYFGKHPWGDLTTADWTSLQRYARKDSVDFSGYATPNRQDVSEEQKSIEEMTAIRETPDEFGDVIAYLVNGAPLTVLEQGDEWTRVLLGRETGTAWKLEGWIRTEELAFGKEIDPDTFAFRTSGSEMKKAMVATDFTQQGEETVTEIQVPHSNAFEIGEAMLDGQYYKLLWFIYTQEVGLLLGDASMPVVVVN